MAVLDPRVEGVTQFPLVFSSGAVMLGGKVVQLGVPYASGLNVQANSGAPGYTCSYTPTQSGA